MMSRDRCMTAEQVLEWCSITASSKGRKFLSLGKGVIGIPQRARSLQQIRPQCMLFGKRDSLICCRSRAVSNRSTAGSLQQQLSDRRRSQADRPKTAPIASFPCSLCQAVFTGPYGPLAAALVIWVPQANPIHRRWRSEAGSRSDQMKSASRSMRAQSIFKAGRFGARFASGEYAACRRAAFR